MTAADEEAARLCPSSNAFEDVTIRRIFLGRVFALVGLQLIVVTASVLVCMRVDTIYDFLTAEDNFYWVCGALGAVVLTYIISVILYCFVPVVQKRVPHIIILLSTVTASSTVTFSIVCTTFGVTAVVVFLALTASCCVGLFVLSLAFTDELCVRRGFVFCILWVFFFTANAMIIPFSTYQLKLAAGCVSAVTLCIMFYDIHRIMDRSKGNVPSLVFYFDAMFELHSDIFIIFTIVLAILALLICGRCSLFRFCRKSRVKGGESLSEAHAPPDDYPQKPTHS